MEMTISKEGSCDLRTPSKEFKKSSERGVIIHGYPEVRKQYIYIYIVQYIQSQ